MTPHSYNDSHGTSDSKNHIEADLPSYDSKLANNTIIMLVHNLDVSEGLYETIGDYWNMGDY